LAEGLAKCHFLCIAEGLTDPRIQGKEFDMRDDFLTADWAEHHGELSSGIDRGLAALRAGISRFWQWDGTSHQLLALLVSFAITALTFNATAA